LLHRQIFLSNVQVKDGSLFAFNEITDEAARQFGADNDTALNIGLAVDMAVPVALSLSPGAARVAYVRVGNFRLVEHEALQGIRSGGYPIATPIAITEDD